MITSMANQQMKHLQHLQKKSKLRNEEGLFVTEGIRMYREVPEECLEKTYISESFFEKYKEDHIWRGEEMEIVKDSVFQSVSDTKTPQGILCIVKQQHYAVSELLQVENPFLMVLENLQDPGNLGTIMRTAEGAGVTGIIMSSDTVDIYNPKTIRSTMGSLYRMPFVYVENLKEYMRELKEKQIHTYAAHLNGTEYHDKFDYTGGSAFLIGNEGNGLSEELAACADTYIRIPMAGHVESLNAAIASAILMYEAERQRRTKS